MRNARTRKYVYRTTGVFFLASMVAFVLLTVAIYDKKFVESVDVTLQASRIGNQLSTGSEVKVRGVVVGEVREVRSLPDGAEVSLALEPDQAPLLPPDVSALLVPKTLFGARYVQLSIPDAPAAGELRDGDVIAQDRSANAIELERVFDDLLPVLRAVQPQKLATTLTAVSTALEGRGEQIGDTLATANEYLEGLLPSLPELNDNIRDLAGVAKLYSDIAPDLLDALTDSAVILGTVADERGRLDALYSQVGVTTQDTQTFLRANSANIIRLSATSREALELGARYSPSFPCTLKAMTELKPSMDKVLGAGTGEPGLHLEASITESRGAYQPGLDTPAYTATGGPRCYPSGVVPDEGSVAAAPGTRAHPLLPGPDADLGLPNSPQEREVVATLLAPELGVPAAQVPAWSSVLVGPVFRGAEVSLR